MSLYYAKNKAKVQKKSKEYRLRKEQEDPGIWNRKSREWYQKKKAENPEYLNKRYREYYQKNRTKILQQERIRNLIKKQNAKRA